MIYENHPVADLFPMLAEDELEELAADIRQRGQLQPIMLDADGRILDGRNRLAACRLAGVEPQFADYAGDDPDGYALAVNIARRHLSTGARAMIVARAARSNNYKFVTVADAAEVPNTRVSEANLVLDWAPGLADAVITGAKPLSVAVDEAREAKRKAEALQSKMNRLRIDANDLASLVDEGRMDVDDATAALDAREAKVREEMDEEKRREHQRSVQRAEEIQAAKETAERLVGRVQSDVAAIRVGADSGAEGLVSKKMLADLDAAIDVLREMLK